MNRLFFIYIAILLCKIAFSAVLRSEGEKCEECTKQFDESISPDGAAMKKLLSIDPVKVPIGIGACKHCLFSGFNTMKRVDGQEICVTKTASGDIVRRVVVELASVNRTCDCDVHNAKTPMNHLGMAIKTMTNPLLQKCGIGKLSGASEILANTIDANIVPEVAACIPALTNLMQSRDKIDHFTLGGVWRDFQFGFDLVTDANGQNVRIENAELLSLDLSKVEEFCGGSAALIDVCKCLNKKHFRNVYNELAKLMIPCGLEEVTRTGFKDVLNELACKV